mgnify:CR=1 FL=1
MKKEEHWKRLDSLDALRGLDMFLLVGLAPIFSAIPKVHETPFFRWLALQMTHPEWQGFTIYDIVFPMFIFIVGVAMPFSFSKRLKEEGSTKKLLRHVLTRFITLSIIGVFLWQKPGLAHPRYGYYSVLYRIGFSYFLAALIFMNTSSVKSIVYWAFGLLIGYWLLMRCIPVPVFSAGDFSREGNLMTYIGNQVSMYISPNFGSIHSISLVGSVANALLGVLTGLLLKSDRSGNEKTTWLLLSSIGLIILGLLMHLDFPINKKIGSTSFVFVTSGISAFLLSLFYWLIDVRGYKKWSYIFIVVGTNSIAIYIANSLVNFKSVSNAFVGIWDFTDSYALMLALTMCFFKWLFCYYLYKQKIFFKI